MSNRLDCKVAFVRSSLLVVPIKWFVKDLFTNPHLYPKIVRLGKLGDAVASDAGSQPCKSVLLSKRKTKGRLLSSLLLKQDLLSRSLLWNDFEFFLFIEILVVLVVDNWNRVFLTESVFGWSDHFMMDFFRIPRCIFTIENIVKICFVCNFSVI